VVFKTTSTSSAVPDSPEKLLRELPRRKIADVLLHQGEVMREYAQSGAKEPDVALQLPTGSGKTLVGLMIGEWLRRKNGERVVYLCPTRQLVNQVVDQATGSYGLTLNGFTGSRRDYDPKARASYLNADTIAVTTYSSLFNTNPFFNDPDVIIVDDAHAAENYIADMWSLRVERTEKKHEELYTALSGVLRQHIEPGNFARLTGVVESIADRAWVDKLPTPVFFNLRRDIEAVLDVHTTGDKDLEYPWSLLREHLHACHLFCHGPLGGQSL
jgi:replicative superfamily II helicase